MDVDTDVPDMTPVAASVADPLEVADDAAAMMPNPMTAACANVWTANVPETTPSPVRPALPVDVDELVADSCPAVDATTVAEPLDVDAEVAEITPVAASVALPDEVDELVTLIDPADAATTVADAVDVLDDVPATAPVAARVAVPVLDAVEVAAAMPVPASIADAVLTA